MTNRQSTHSYACWSWGPKHYEGELAMSIDTEALKERIYALEADLDTAQHADHEETIRALVVAADRLATLEARLAAAQQPAESEEPLTDTYVQTVPDKCDRIVWRGSYYHLPLRTVAQEDHNG